MNDRPHYVYRCYDATGSLLYVGMTYNPPARMRQHSKKAPWFDQAVTVRFIVFPNRAYAAIKERDAIILERPRFNKTHRYWGLDQVGRTNGFDEARDLDADSFARLQNALSGMFRRPADMGAAS